MSWRDFETSTNLENLRNKIRDLETAMVKPELGLTFDRVLLQECQEHIEDMNPKASPEDQADMAMDLYEKVLRTMAREMIRQTKSFYGED